MSVSEKNRVLLVSLTHATTNAHLLVMAADFRVHRRCAGHRLTADMAQIVDDPFHTALKRMVALDAR
jgi:hypothetical protein